MTTVGFIGLGIMGAPMAENLVRAGFDVVGYNRSPGKADALVAAGGRKAASVAEAVARSDVVITMLPDSPDVEQVALGEDGVVANAAAGLLYIDCSTIQPSTARKLAEAGKLRAVKVLDAPVSGGESGAKAATLSIMVGGDVAAFEQAQPVLSAVGKTIVHVGPAGAGQTVKAANQLLVAGTIELVAEALVFLQAQSVDREAAVKVLAGGLAGSAVLERKSEQMLAHSFEPGFRLKLHHKDLGILQAAARDAGVALPLGAVVAQLVGAMVARGDGGLDHSALLKLVEDLSGVDPGRD